MNAYARLRSALTYPNVVSTLALFAAVGGISYAAGVLPRNSVGTAQLQGDSVTSPKLAFSLGIADSTKPATTLESAVCSPFASCPAPPRHVLTGTRLRLKRTPRVLLLGSATFSAAAASEEEPISVSLGTGVGLTSTTGQFGELEGPDPVTLSLRRVVSPPASPGGRARHAFELDATAVRRGTTSASVNVGHAQLIAIALPPAR